MKRMTKLVAVVALAGVLGAAGVAYAAASTPAEIAAGLTGKTVEELSQERANGKTYGTIANEAGKLDEFKQQMLENRKAILDQRVKDGRMTQENADRIYNQIEENMSDCDGTGSAGMGRGCGIGKGNGNGNGNGNGARFGGGNGMGCGMRGNR